MKTRPVKLTEPCKGTFLYRFGEYQLHIRRCYPPNPRKIPTTQREGGVRVTSDCIVKSASAFISNKQEDLINGDFDFDNTYETPEDIKRRLEKPPCPQ